MVGLLLAAGVLTAVRPPSGRAASSQFVILGDGTSIALNVRLPDHYEPGRRYPTVFEMSGYDGGGRRRDPGQGPG